MYRLVRFGSTSLDYANQVDTVGSGSTPYAYQALPTGGAIDIYGSTQKRPGAVDRSKSFRLLADTQEGLSALYMGLLAQVGRRDQLYRRLPGGAMHWQYARLVQLDAERNYTDARFRIYQDVTLKFVTESSCWYGKSSADWYLDSGVALDDGYYLDVDTTQVMDTNPFEFTLTLGSASDAGRAPVRSLQISVVAGSQDISAINISRADGEAITFSGVIPSGSTLIIDTGTMQVTLDDADAYADFAFSGKQWFSLEPGANPITVTLTGGSNDSTINLFYYEAWY